MYVQLWTIVSVCTTMNYSKCMYNYEHYSTSKCMYNLPDSPLFAGFQFTQYEIWCLHWIIQGRQYFFFMASPSVSLSVCVCVCLCVCVFVCVYVVCVLVFCIRANNLKKTSLYGFKYFQTNVTSHFCCWSLTSIYKVKRLKWLLASQVIGKTICSIIN